MTSTPMTYADPREVVARAMQDSKAWPVVFAAGSADELARAALAALRTHGFLSDLCFTAMKANAK